MSVSKLKTIPSGYRVKETSAGTFLVKKTRSRSRKLSKRQRMAISKAAKKFKLPVLTLGVQLPWLSKSVEVFGANGSNLKALKYVGEQVILPSFTGIHIDSAGNATFDLKNLYLGLLPNVLLYGVSKTGVFRGINRNLSKMKLPLRFV